MCTTTPSHIAQPHRKERKAKCICKEKQKKNTVAVIVLKTEIAYREKKSGEQCVVSRIGAPRALTSGQEDRGGSWSPETSLKC